MSSKDSLECSQSENTERQLARTSVAEAATATPGCSKWPDVTDSIKDNRRKTRAAREKKRYWEDEAFREKKKQRGKKKYAEDEEYRGRLIEQGKKKYSEDDQCKRRLIREGNREYAADDEYRAQRIRQGKRKYAEDDKYRDRLIQQGKRKYAEDDQYRARSIRQGKRKYAEDSQYRGRLIRQGKIISAKKYSTNPAYRIRKQRESKAAYQQRKAEICAASASKYQQKKQSKAKGRNDITKVAANFRKTCTEGPDHICTVCHRLLFPNQVHKCSRSKYRTCKKPETARKCITGKYVHTCMPGVCHDPCHVMSTPSGQEWICFTCDRHLTNGNIPPEAYNNNLDPGNVPKELSDLNSLEQHLLACELPFAKIVSLPKGGQRGIHGPVVCVPSNLKKTTTALHGESMIVT